MDASPCDNVVTFTGVTRENIQHVKEINLAVFPLSYSDAVYNDMIACGDVTQLAYLHGKCIASIGCRLQMKEDGCARLYIFTLGVLAPYRNAGVGSELLRRSLLICENDAVINEAQLHVQADNHAAVRFYERHGFEKERLEPNYYPSLPQPDAVVLRRDIIAASPAQCRSNP